MTSTNNDYIYIGAGTDTKPFDAKWVDGATIHCIDSQPHSEFGIHEYYPSKCSSNWRYKSLNKLDNLNFGTPDGITPNGFARPNFARIVLGEYEEKGYECSIENWNLILNTGLLGPTYTRLGGGPTRVRFFNTARNITIWYHFNTVLPHDVQETLEFIGPFDTIICKGHDPHKSIVDRAVDNTLTFRGYAGTAYGIHDLKTSTCMTVQLSFDPTTRSKFKHFVFYDTYGDEHWFNTWEEFLVFYDCNPDLTFEEEDSGLE